LSQTLIFCIFATQPSSPLILQTINSVRSIDLSLKYGKFKFVAEIQFLKLIFRGPKFTLLSYHKI